jgi:hypothetical protein
VEINITDATPAAVPLSINGQILPEKFLFRPLMKFSASKVWDLQDSSSSCAAQMANASEAKQPHSNTTWFFLLPLNSTVGEPVNFQLPTFLDEGYYRISAELSLVTEYPTLIGLTGVENLTPPENINVDNSVGELVLNSTYQFMKEELAADDEFTRLRVQYTRLAAVTASAPETGIQVGSSF